MKDTVDAVNLELAGNKITQEEAAALIKELHPRTKYVYCHDTLNFQREDRAMLSAPSQRWYYSRWVFSCVNYKDGDERQVHNDDLKTYTFYCTINEMYYALEDFTKILVEGKVVCLEDSLDKVEYENGNYYHKAVITTEDLDDNGRACYHSARRLTTRKQGIGVELELECHKNINRFCTKARKFGIFAEDDGSLDEEYGVELIGPIAPFEDYVAWKHWGPMFDIFPEHKCVGHDAGNEYGIHVSLSLSLFSDLDLSKFVLFFNTCSNLCKAVAQRDRIYSGRYGAQSKHKRFKKTLTDKYEAVMVDNVRAEVRIFRSTVRKDRFLKNIEFCEAVRYAVKHMSAGTVLREEEAQKAFLTFLTKERKTYPNLFNFLVEKKFLVDDRKKLNTTIESEEES
jgi:hypothetical protein